MAQAARFWEWYYLIFLLPGLLAVALLLVSSAFSLGSDSDSDADGDADTDADVDADADMDGDGDAEAEGETDSEAEDTPSLSAGLLRLVGADRAPLSLTGGAFFLGWGFFGFWAEELLAAWLPRPALFLGPALLIALAGAALTARGAAAIAVRVIPKTVTAAVSRESLVGQEARVVYPVSATGGRAFYYDKNAVLHDVTCRVRPGEATIPKGQKIILAGYDPESRWFRVEISPFGED